MGKAKTRKPRQAAASREAKLAVAQVYWNNDQEYKQAEGKRNSSRALALVAIPKGETVGAVVDDDGMGHWLTHGEKERVEMNPYALRDVLPDPLEFCRVDVAALKEAHPLTYEQLMRHKTTVRTTHDCLTWSDREPRARAKRAIS
jgi:hypothetical protein